MSAANPLTYSGATDESTGRRARKALLREIEADHKKKAKEALTGLRSQLRAARAAHREALKGAVARCRAHRKAVSEKLKAERAQALAELRAKGEGERARARGECAVDKGTAGENTKGAVALASEELAKERGFQEDMKRIERGNRERRRAAKPSTAAERRSESDDEVRNNIPAELVGLFEKVKRSIKGGPRETRTETFLRYAEEHPSEYLESIDDKTEALIRDLERREREAVTARNPATVAEASKQYVRDHWGQRGSGRPRKLSAADPRIPSVELGELVAIVYRTKKGEDLVLTDYEHEFEHPRPRLAYNESGLLIAGGIYRVTTRGIVG